MMWQVTITIVNTEDLSQIKIRHKRPLDQVNLVVILAQRCHYLGTCKYDFCSLFLNSAVWCELSASMVLYGARMVPYSARMVLYGVRMVLYGVRMVLYGARMVPYGTSLVPHNFIQNLPLNELLVPRCENS